MRSRGWLPCGLLLLAQGATAPDVSAEPSVDARDAGGTAKVASDVRVLLLAFEAEEWTSRARSQLGDITGAVSEAPERPPASLRDQLELVRRLAREQRADIVAWMAPDLTAADADVAARESAGTYALVWTASDDAHDARRLSAPWSRLSAADRSAALEMAAMSVRSAVRALQLERAQGSPEPGDDVTAPPRAPRAPDESHSPPAHGSPETPEPPPWKWQAGAALQWQLDGQTSHGMSSLEGSIGVRRGKWSTSLVAAVGLGASIETSAAEVALDRHGLGLELGRLWVLSSRWSVAATLRVAAQWTRRETVPTSPDVLPTTSREQVAPAVSGGLRGAYQLSAPHAVTLDVGAGWYPLAPSYVIEDATRAERMEYPLWKVQPSLAVGWVFSK